MTRVCSMLSQILRWFPREEFDSVVREHKGERHARGALAGSSLWQCCIARWGTCRFCGSFAVV